MYNHFDALIYAFLTCWLSRLLPSDTSLSQVTSYAHGSSDLLGIQIDAAINPGK